MNHPANCFSHDPANNCTITKLGKSCYELTHYPEGEYDDDIVNEINARRGITPQMRNAMECCSIAAQNNPDLDWEKHYQMCLEMETKR